MIKHLKKNKKNGFTLVEVIIVGVVFAFIVVGIIGAINRSYMFMNNIKYQVIATNLAREGVEMMFNIRDTNWKKYSGEKDKMRLLINPDKSTGEQYEDPYMFGLAGRSTYNQFFTLKEQKSGLNKYIYASHYTGWMAQNLGICDSDCFSESKFWKKECACARNASKIQFTGTYSYFSGNNIYTGNISDLLSSETDFYRVVELQGVYKKNSNDNSELLKFKNDLTNSDPKELRFCVKVFYKTNAPHSTELCSITTNFEK